MITQQGRNSLLRIMFAKQPPVSGWFLALYTDSSTEYTDYDGSRPLWSHLSISNEIVTGLITVPIVPNSSATIVGMALHSTDVKGSTAGIKASYQELSTPITLTAGQPYSAIYRVGW